MMFIGMFKLRIQYNYQQYPIIYSLYYYKSSIYIYMVYILVHFSSLFALLAVSFIYLYLAHRRLDGCSGY